MKSILYKNRYTFLSLLIILGMYVAYTLVYDPSSPVYKAQGVVEGTGDVNIGGPFEMVDQNGAVFTDQNLAGSYYMVFFGFTHCPDICPTGLSTMALAYDALDETMQSQLKMVFVTVDPARDTPEHLKNYVGAFHEGFVGLTGSDAQVKRIADNFLVYYAKQLPDKTGMYMMDHSGYIYLMGPDGKYVKHFSHKDDVDEIVQTLQQTLAK